MWASGDAFVAAVRFAFRELGLEAAEGPHPRADILAWDGTTVAAIEAKGLEGPSKEGDLRQAESWVTDVKRSLSYAPEDREGDPDMKRYADIIVGLGVPKDSGQEIPCKGIMVIGTFRKTSLDQRTQRDFPDSLTRVINRSGISAVSGLELLVLLAEARNAAHRKREIIDRLFRGNGVLEGSDWRGALSAVSAS